MHGAMDERQIEAWFERFRAHGDAAALGQVFDATARDLLVVARHLTHDRASAEDLVQATFLAAIENASRFDATRPLKPWLVGILVRQAGLQRRKRNASTLDSLEHAAKDDPLAEISARELSDALARAFEKLSPSDREVLVPLLVDGKRAVEIARELQRRPDTIHMRIHRGLARLRKLLPAGFSLGAVLAFTSRRGLAAVRSEVMNAAQRAAGMNPLVAPGAATATAIGGALVIQKLVLAAVVVVVAIGIGWLALHRSTTPTPFLAKSDARPHDVVAPNEQRSQSDVAIDPESASTSSPRASIVAANSSTARFTFIESDGSPAAGCKVALVDAHDVVQSATTDETGSLELPASGDHVDLYIARARALPFHATLALDAGTQRIELPAGKEVSGRVRVSGATPDRPIDLVLNCDRSPFENTRARAEVAQVFGFDNFRWASVPQNTASDGTFRWNGLADDWSGSIHVSYSYKIPGPSLREWGGDDVRLEAPTHDVLVDLERLPCLKGRVVEAGNRIPVAGAQVSWLLAWSDGLNNTDVWARTDEHGRFEATLKESGFLWAELSSLTDTNGRGFGHARFERRELGADLDVGDIALERPQSRDIRFFVHDRDAHPIAGALARVGTQYSHPTNEQGRGELAAVPVDAKTLKLCARGFHPAQIELGGTEAEVLDVSLEPTNELAITVIGIPKESNADVKVHLVSAEPLFESTPQWLPDSFSFSVAAGCFSSASPAQHGRPGCANGSLDDHGRFVVHDLRPEAVVTLQVVGPMGIVMHEESLGSLARTERRNAVVHLDDVRRGLEGRVLSEDGTPLANAQVFLRRTSQDGASAQTDGSGRFRFWLVAAESLELSASRPGWVTCDLKDVSPDMRQPIEIHLEKGHELCVEVVDPRGLPVPDVFVRVRPDGRSRWSLGLKDGRGGYLVRDLPLTSCAVVVDASGKSFEKKHDLSEPHVRFELPASGKVAFHWKHSVDREDDRAVEVRLRSVATEAEALEWMMGSVAEGAHTFETVFPGEYTISIDRWSRASDEAPVVWTPIMTPQRVTVVADETVHVELRL
jgi:RNA polymerase sigma-70 factor (ECF subfamily)